MSIVSKLGGGKLVLAASIAAMFGAAATPVLAEDDALIATYARGGGVLERYEARPEGLAQSFEIAAFSGVAERAGDLTVRIQDGEVLVLSVQLEDDGCRTTNCSHCHKPEPCKQHTPHRVRWQEHFGNRLTGLVGQNL